MTAPVPRLGVCLHLVLLARCLSPVLPTWPEETVRPRGANNESWWKKLQGVLWVSCRNWWAACWMGTYIHITVVFSAVLRLNLPVCIPLLDIPKPQIVSENSYFIISSGLLRCAGHVARIGGLRNAFKMLVGNLTGGDYSWGLGVGGMIILEWILGKEGEKV
jgi:hypothetical protein